MYRVESMSKPKETKFSMKYLQLADAVIKWIETDKLHINDKLPSVTELMRDFQMSKETVLKGLTHLSEQGIIESVLRQGNFVRKKASGRQLRICLILDKMNILRDKIYHSFFDAIKDYAEVDVFFHHHNFKVFENLVKENLNNYTHFVVVTFLREDPAEVLNLIPPHKRVILDYNVKNLTGDYLSIFQDFEADIYDSLVSLQENIQKYKRLVLIAPNESYHGESVIKGFKQFCKEFGYPCKIYHQVSGRYIQKGDALLTFSRYDQDDVAIIKLANKNYWKLGKDIGLISYNDTAVKEILEGGITVISTDFVKMGKHAAKAMLEKEIYKVRQPAEVVMRNSF